jgi:hypothetical protein
MPYRGARDFQDEEYIGEVLDKAGEERFLAKVTRFRKSLTNAGSNQSLYEAIMESLGYAKNKDQMVELALHIPIKRLDTEIHERKSDTRNVARLQAFLLGSAGLLPSQRSDGHRRDIPHYSWVDKLEKLWSLSGLTVAMKESDWHFFKVRPGNIPTRRIAAISYLILRYHQLRIPEWLSEDHRSRFMNKGYHEMEKLLYVPATGYWADYLDFGLPIRKNPPALLGKERAADIIINVLLPFALLQAEQYSYPELASRILNIYHHYPRLMVNRIERHMCNQLGMHSSLVNSACRQQGLIHIYQTLCLQAKCYDCALGTKCKYTYRV